MTVKELIKFLGKTPFTFDLDVEIAIKEEEDDGIEYIGTVSLLMIGDVERLLNRKVRKIYAADKNKYELILEQEGKE